VTLLDQIRQTITRYAMLRPGDRLGIAVSGGADSLCLLHVLLELRDEFNLTLSIIHVDHNLRGPQSQADAEFVHKCAQQFSLPFHIRTLDLDSGHGNLEQEARRARHQFFRELIQNGTVDRIALGHTRSDQAETVLFRLLRGSGSAGLAGIRPVTDSGVIRPLIQVTRPQVESWLQKRGISWREDATNADLRFDRNRIRHRLLPHLEAEWNPGLSDILARTADWAFEEEQYWRQEIPRLAENWLCFAKESAVVDADRLAALPVAVARRLIRMIVERVKHDLLGVDFAHIEAVRHLASQSEGGGRLHIAGLEVVRSFNWLRFAKPADSDPDWHFAVTAPGSYVFSCKTDERFLSSGPEITLKLELLPNNGVYNRDVNALDWDKIGGPAGGGQLMLRNWRPGDQYQRQGHAGPERLKKLFQDFRIPLWERHKWPIITVGDSIVWAGQFGPAAHLAVDAGSRTVLRILLGA
jgi:tRNA(Ile)-lysidine synthase